MTNNTNAKTRKVQLAAGLLWVSDIRSPRRAPDRFGGQRWQFQMDEIKACAKRYGDTLTDEQHLFFACVAAHGSAGDRLERLVEFANWYPTRRRLFVPGSVFADLSSADRDMHIQTLKMQDVELIFCNE